MKELKYLLLFVCVIFVGCDPEIEVPNEISSGTADFSNYIAVGNSLTAGYANRGLYEESQLTSFPNLLAEQMKSVGGGDFNQPIMEGSGSGYLSLKGLIFNDSTGLTPVIDSVLANPNAFSKVEGSINNFGIPGLRAKDVATPGYATVNPYLGRLLADQELMKTYTQVIEEQEATFFTCWLGNNDILNFAAPDGEPGTGIYVLTPVEEFSARFSDMMAAFGEAKGVVLTIPDILVSPLFTTIPKTLIPITNQEDADQLNAGYADYNEGVDLYNSQVPEDKKINRIEFSVGLNYPVVVDKSIPFPDPGKISQLKEGHLLLNIPRENLISKGWGTAVAIPDQYALTKAEIDSIHSRISAYNTIIRSYESANVAVVETNELIQKIAQGMLVNGAPVNATFINGGVFSLDGAHLTPRGNALLANEVIKVINNKFSASLPPLQVTTYKGIDLPQ